jgi:hypothetical protein
VAGTGRELKNSYIKWLAWNQKEQFYIEASLRKLKNIYTKWQICRNREGTVLKERKSPLIFNIV